MKISVDGAGTCQVLEAAWGQVNRLATESVFEAAPEWEWELEEGAMHSESKLLQFWGPSEKEVSNRAQEVCGGTLEDEPLAPRAVPANLEVKCLRCSGDSSNRIDVVFMGDGYTASERERFYGDMTRLTEEMFADVTFMSWLPLFNIWAIFVPSEESGIGYYGTPKKTPFQLYKQGTQHRGVMYTSEGQSMAREVCKQAPGCDYPSLIGNDDFYGGLGGEFVIGTRSKTSGTTVLRHEMGHNFVSVGEEYDNGGVYRGVNSDRPTGWSRPKPKQDIKWKHWLTEPSAQVVEQKMNLALAQYPWKDLAGGKQSFSFETDGDYSSWEMSFTVSGCPEEGSLKVLLDGKELSWRPAKPEGAERPDGASADRLFYHFSDANAGLTKGRHTLSFESGFAPPEGAPIRQLCSISIYEYGSERDFKKEPGYVGAFPTWDYRGRKSYRPTNEQCLMRNMESTFFCPVCREGMWLQFLSRITLIDSVDVAQLGGGLVSVELKAVPLAQFRVKPVQELVESYTVSWSKGGVQQDHLRDAWAFNGTAGDLGDSWQVTLTLTSSEVRRDPNGLLTSEKSFKI